MFDRYADRRSVLAIHFFFATLIVFGLASGLGAGLVEWSSSRTPREFGFPPAFWLSSIALLTGSFALQRAVWFVKREKQRSFRSHLIVALIAGTLFVSLQIFGMWDLLRSREVLFDETVSQLATSLGAKPYVFVAAFLHAIHFVVALMFLVFVVLNGFGGRYDHEYYWGVSVCTWFWHALGMIWLAIIFLLLVIAG